MENKDLGASSGPGSREPSPDGLGPAGFDPSRKPQNKCCVTSWPAGHPYACNDCDPCLLGSFPLEWCETCAGDCWIGDRPCYNCDGSGFRPRDSDEHPKGEDAERLSGEAMPARAEGIAHA